MMIVVSAHYWLSKSKTKKKTEWRQNDVFATCPHQFPAVVLVVSPLLTLLPLLSPPLLFVPVDTV